MEPVGLGNTADGNRPESGDTSACGTMARQSAYARQEGRALLYCGSDELVKHFSEPCQDSLKIFVKNVPFSVVDDVVGMRTEVKPLWLGRNVSAYSNDRRDDHLVRNPWPHVLIRLTPRMIFLRLSHYPGSDRGWAQLRRSPYRFVQLREGYALSPVSRRAERRCFPQLPNAPRHILRRARNLRL